MADPRSGRSGRWPIVAAQLLLVVAAGTLWGASRLPWVLIRSFDGLGPPRDVILSGAAWSTALVPLAVLLLAAVVAVLAVRGWPLRLLAVLVALAGLAAGYLGVSLWVVPDVAVRAADLAHVPLMTLVGSERRHWGAGLAVAAAVGTVIAAVLLMRWSFIAGTDRGAVKYAAPATRRSISRREDAAGAMLEGSEKPSMSERMIWDALDEGHDPTDRPGQSDTEGR